MNRVIFLTIVYLIGCLPFSQAQNSPAFSFEIKKPKNLEDKQLPSEKTGNKKFTLPRRVFQNTVTHYNWYFNGNEKLKEILARSKDAHKDDYTQLLTFYNYTVAETLKDSIELDSVIIKANSGILLHDLRNDWIDNLYLLMAKAYYFKGIYDTAYLHLQYINYAFSPKEKDGYDKLIGSNANEGGNAFSISTPETKNLFKKAITHTPSRNESFIWQIRTFLAREEYPEAASMIETVKTDPLFPARLRASISEMQALWYYQQLMYDSAARHLEDALPNAANLEEKARWEFLIGQLYAMSNRSELARDFFERAVKHTLNPVLEVYARLNVIRQNKGDDLIAKENIASLIRMARKDRYSSYRDIIYFAAAQMELERANFEGAKALLLKSTQSAQQDAADPSQKSKSFLLLGDLSFNEGHYSDAKSYYDSVSMLEIVPDQKMFEKRKGVLTTMAVHNNVIIRQDSLQRLANMPEAEREVLLKKMVKRLRKLEGLKEEEELYIPVSTTAPVNNAPPQPDLNDNAKGDWYFYNASLRSRGYNEFRSIWGNRPNVDNWRRSAVVSKMIQQRLTNTEGPDAKTAAAEKESKGTTYESLLMGLPLTANKIKTSNDSIANAQYEIGNALMEGLEDYPTAIKTFEAYRNRFPTHQRMPKALKGLYYCYQKTGMLAEAEAIKQLMLEKFEDAEETGLVQESTTPKQDATQVDDMTRRYEKIYGLFLEGKFADAIAEKNAADQVYKHNYWTPQLLYIQSIYLIKQQQDESALSVLGDLIKLFPGTVMASKAERLMEVLGRRQEIEKHLRELKIERPADAPILLIDDAPAARVPVAAPAQEKRIAAQPTPPIQLTDSSRNVKPAAPSSPEAVTVKKAAVNPFPDSAALKNTALVNKEVVTPPPPVQAPPRARDSLITSQTVPTPLEKPITKKDSIRTNEAINTPAETPKTVVPPVAKASVPPAQNDSIQAGKKVAVNGQPAKTEPTALVKDAAPLTKNEPVVTPPPTPALVNGLFILDTNTNHAVVIVMDKVDKIFVNEARNAFSRYNMEYPDGRGLTCEVSVLNDNTKLLLIQPFDNAMKALAYIRRTEKTASTELIPWLPKEKYRFIIANKKNIETIQSIKSLSEYLSSLKELYPGQHP